MIFIIRSQAEEDVNNTSTKIQANLFMIARFYSCQAVWI